MRFLLLLFCCCCLSSPELSAQQKPKVVLAIHGGAGTILKSQMSPEKEKAYTEALSQALQEGYRILQKGGSSLDAVEATIKILEDSPLFNAGKGAVLTSEGKAELDASIMDGKTLAAGSIAGVSTLKNPIVTARRVMEKSEHVMMIGLGAEKFAKSFTDIQFVKPAYFMTEERRGQWERMKQKEKGKNDKPKGKASALPEADKKFGTVGCVALDQAGNLAAGTSTGGMMNKRFGRVGDAPIIGAGTYADNSSCAVSATGWGEYFIRLAVAHDIAALIAYKQMPLQEAAQEVINKVGRLGGSGGVIALNAKGQVAMPFNTEGMYRGYITEDGKIEVMIYK